MDETNPPMIALLVFNVIVIVVMLLFWWWHGFSYSGVLRFLLDLLIAFILGGAGAGAVFAAMSKK